MQARCGSGHPCGCWWISWGHQGNPVQQPLALTLAPRGRMCSSARGNHPRPSRAGGCHARCPVSQVPPQEVPAPNKSPCWCHHNPGPAGLSLAHHEAGAWKATEVLSLEWPTCTLGLSRLNLAGSQAGPHFLSLTWMAFWCSTLPRYLLQCLTPAFPAAPSLGWVEAACGGFR